MTNKWTEYTAQPVMLRNTVVEYINRNDEMPIVRRGEAGDVCWHWVARWRIPTQVDAKSTPE
jgi:hypothetical protein